MKKSIQNYLSVLNPAQYAAVTAPLAPVCILAGAGSGKTRVLVSRITWLIDEHNIAPWAIMAVTFTNKAALEMKTRLENQASKSLNGMWIGTFHALCNRFLRLHYADCNLPENFQIIDSDDQLRLIKRICKTRGLDEKAYPPRSIANFISSSKDEGLRSNNIEAYHEPLITQVELYKQYEAICMQSGLVDFSEIILRVLETLRAKPALLKHYQERFSHILVDEFQDTNAVQYAWLQLLSMGHKRLFVVGDDDQSIYGWRGAQVGNILGFNNQFENVTTVRLEQNYRSIPSILMAANHVISKNITRLDKKLWTDQLDTSRVKTYAALDGYDEARYVVDSIKQHIKDNHTKNDCAILYRSNAQSRLFEEMLLRANMPYRVHGGLRFFDRAEIKDASSYIRLTVNPHDDVALERAMSTPPKGIGASTIDKLRQHASLNKCSLWSALEDLIESQTLTPRAQASLLSLRNLISNLSNNMDDYALDAHFAMCIDRSLLKPMYLNEPMGRGEDRIENLNELISAASHFGAELQRQVSLEAASPTILDHNLFEAKPLAIMPSTREQLAIFLAQISLDSTENQAQVYEDSVQLMTLHAAKGLEFPIVFLVGLEEGIFPSEMSAREPERLEEERRLAYVGITRAEKHLSISYCATRMHHGRMVTFPKSRFLNDIPDECLQMTGPALKLARTVQASQNKYGYQNNYSSANLHGARTHQVATQDSVQGFKLGQSILHEKFGEGVILGFEGDGPQARVSIRFAKGGTKILVLSYAKLEAI